MSRFRCERPSKVAGWLLHDGTFLPARCGASNKCAYCAYLTTVENALVVALDAERELPQVGLALTTVDPSHGAKRFREDVAHAFKMIRRELGADVGYLGLVEFSTGLGKRSGGHRRLHMHALLKRCAPSEAEAIEPQLRCLWERRTGAHRVELRALRSPAGATAYLIHHHRKREQAPPEGWSGKRLRPSRNYWETPIADLRLQARLMLKDKRLRRAANRLVAWEELDGAPDELLDAEWRAARDRARAEAAAATFCKVGPFGELRPIRRAA